MSFVSANFQSKDNASKRKLTLSPSLDRLIANRHLIGNHSDVAERVSWKNVVER